MSYSVAIVADSVAPNGARLTTFALKYPRMIHSELMTHRVFSRNASSTRAIPTAKMIEWVERDPAMPVYWGKNQRGMQATEELVDDQVECAKRDWLKGRDHAIHVVKSLMEIGVHKQIASRILEPWAHINVVVSSTDFLNFFALRCHWAAMPEIQRLAVMMARAYRDSVPAELQSGWWHLPFATPAELQTLCRFRQEDTGEKTSDGLLDYLFCLKRACTARCARVSYKTFEGKEPNLVEDIALHDRLVVSGHWSPFEHCAQALGREHANHRSGNFRGWEQYRKAFVGENRAGFDFATLDRFGEDGFIVQE